MKTRFNVLDIFRGIFSSMVVLFHLSAFSDTILLNNNFVYNADLFVDFFFVLSGFVIAYNYQFIATGKQLKQFYIKRFLRIYPLHLLLLLAFAGIEIIKHSAVGYVKINQLNNENNNLATFFSSFFLFNSVKLPGVTDVSWNIQSWSISAEMIAYLLFGGLMVFIGRWHLYKMRGILYAFIVLSSLSLLVLITGSWKLNYTFNYGFLRGIIGFFTGAISYNAYQYLRSFFRKLHVVFFHFAEAGIILLISIFVYHGFDYKDSGFMHEIIFFFAILFFASERGFISHFLKKSSLLHQMGKYSYSIYMTHTLILSIFNVIFIRLLKFPPSAYVYLFLLNFYFIFVVSSWTYKHIEMRFVKWKLRN